MNFADINIMEILLWYVTFLFSVTLHEAAHAWAAMKGGDLTAYAGGQVSLDPIPHIRHEPFGMLVLPLISLVMRGWPFGFASTPYDPNWAEVNPKKASLMALAGPLSNMLLVILSAFVVWIGIWFNFFAAPGVISGSSIVVATGPGIFEPIALWASMMFTLNLVLLVLNLIPFPPLDGSAVMGLVLSERHARRWYEFIRRPGMPIMGLILAWTVFGPVFHAVFMLSLKILYPRQSYG